MATYVMSDLHGNYEFFIKMLETIGFCDDDTLYVNGDVIDRGPNGIKILMHMMMYPNIFPICGNHEYAALEVLPSLCEEMTKESIKDLDDNFVRNILEYLNIGGQTTLDEFNKLSNDDKQYVIEYLEEFDMYAQVNVGGKQFVIVHAGLLNFMPDRKLDTYAPFELLFKRPAYEDVYFQDKYLITRHTPTRIIYGAEADKIYINNNNHIAIDCGVSFGGTLGCIRLDDLQPFYAKID